MTDGFSYLIIFEKPADSIKRARLNEQFKNIPKADSIFQRFYKGQTPSLMLHIMEEAPLHH